jgi:hypothetical protein
VEGQLVKRLAIAIAAALLLTACPVETWIPIEAVPRQPGQWEHVAYLETMPTRQFVVVGIITPEPGEYETEAAAVKWMKKQAAKHGADAIYIEESTENSGWSFHGTRGGSISTLRIRAKAIAWTGQP